MHGEKGRAELGDAFDTFLHGVADVVQLEVEKELLAGGDQVGGEAEPAGKTELIADFIKADRVAESRDQAFRLAH